MKIEWASDFHSDGTRRSRPKASTVHGWLAKMRGTLAGNERLRSEGMREMREAKAIRRYKRERKAKGGTGFFGLGGAKKQHTAQRQASRRSTPTSRRGQTSTRQPSRRGTQSSSRRAAPQPTRRTTTGHGGRGAKATQPVSARPSTRRHRTT
ncbi:hypothetical protein BDV98DRAFT_569189 [Pterulicium gracile]|uniref:Uncharacterized protein n=1 Tax=Pterulicium gracile TaxID=1884261 RepID=A0A5C3QEP0_9AGAR|nr:hypothetical protein BDV98DRAFT_569189 [Pterula gracilis]